MKNQDNIESDEKKDKYVHQTKLEGNFQNTQKRKKTKDNNSYYTKKNN